MRAIHYMLAKRLPVAQGGSVLVTRPPLVKAGLAHIAPGVTRKQRHERGTTHYTLHTSTEEQRLVITSHHHYSRLTCSSGCIHTSCPACSSSPRPRSHLSHSTWDLIVRTLTSVCLILTSNARQGSACSHQTRTACPSLCTPPGNPHRSQSRSSCIGQRSRPSTRTLSCRGCRPGQPRSPGRSCP